MGRGLIIKEPTDGGESIILVDGQLFLEPNGKHGRLPLRVGCSTYLHIGCHRITWEAWKEIRLRACERD